MGHPETPSSMQERLSSTGAVRLRESYRPMDSPLASVYWGMGSLASNSLALEAPQCIAREGARITSSRQQLLDQGLPPER